MKRAALYARVSTADQKEAMQIREMTEFCEKRGFDPTTFRDPGWSGAKENRPAFNTMMAMVRRRQYDVVIVYKFDRFARSLRQLISALELFHDIGVEFISLHEQIDTTTSTGKLMFGIIGSFAEFERSIISERTKSGLARARAEGTTLGRPPLPVDSSLIRSRRASGASWRAIASEFKLSPATCLRRAQEGRFKKGSQISGA